MATWHQSRNPVPLWHKTLWTIVTDPPNDCLTVMRFKDSDSAHAALKKWQENGDKHSYLIPPEARI